MTAENQMTESPVVSNTMPKSDVRKDFPEPSQRVSVLLRHHKDQIIDVLAH